MKNFKFYLEYPDLKSKRKATRKNLGNHAGNCVAIIEGTKKFSAFPNDLDNDAIAAIQDYKNCPCAFTIVSDGYLNEKCKRISEQQARKIHPELFKYLEQ